MKIKFKEGSIGAYQEAVILKKLGFDGTGDELEQYLKTRIKTLDAQRKTNNINRTVRHPGTDDQVDSG